MHRYPGYNHPEIIEDNEDEMLIQVKCPYCGHPTTIGELIGISGYHGCPHCYFVPGGLRQITMYLQQNDYPAYVRGDFYPKGFEQNKKDYSFLLNE